MRYTWIHAINEAEKCRKKELVLHSDNGAPMKSLTLQAKMHELGVISSRSRPRVSNDNVGR
jgi:transposase InsO family protein